MPSLFYCFRIVPPLFTYDFIIHLFIYIYIYIYIYASSFWNVTRPGELFELREKKDIQIVISSTVISWEYINVILVSCKYCIVFCFWFCWCFTVFVLSSVFFFLYFFFFLICFCLHPLLQVVQLRETNWETNDEHQATNKPEIYNPVWKKNRHRNLKYFSLCNIILHTRIFTWHKWFRGTQEGERWLPKPEAFNKQDWCQRWPGKVDDVL